MISLSTERPSALYQGTAAVIAKNLHISMYSNNNDTKMNLAS